MSQQKREIQAEATAPHWIVKRMSKFGPGEFTARLHFMHPTLEAAETEALRLATVNRGKRFSIYASVSSVKLPKEEPKA